MKRSLATLALLLAACGHNGNQQAGAANGAGGANAPAATATATATAAGGSGAVTIEPGEWETTMLMQMPDVPNLPRGVHMPPPRPMTVRHCITAQDVARSNKAFLGGGNQHGVDCDYSGVTIAGGRIHGTSTCGRNGMQVSMSMDGSFSPTAYDITQQIRTSVQGRTVESSGHMSGRRVGDCAAGAE